MERYKEKTIPIEWESWDSIETAAIQFYNVVFTEDFGEFKKDEVFDCVYVSYEEGWVKAYDEEEKIKRQQFKCIPI